jgi:type IV pilus assembly protein PilC
VPLKNLVYFTRQLATMHRSGMPLLESLNSLAEGEENPRLKEALLDVNSQVQAGLPLYAAFGAHPDIFEPRYVAMIRAGDTSGDLSLALRELANDLEKRSSMEKAIKSATVYPRVITGVAFIILSGLMIFMVPRFANIFEQTASQTCAPGSECSAQLPGLTRVVRNISGLLYPEFALNIFWFLNVIGRFIVLIGLFSLARFLIRRALKSSPALRRRWDRFKLNAPFRIGPLVQKVAIARFARSYASLLKSGITSVEALPIVAETSGNIIIAEAINKARDDILEGKPLWAPLAQSGAFPPTVIQMIRSGESTGKVDEMLDRVAEFYEEEVELSIKGLSSLIEPLMLVVVGGAIGIVIISLYLPMFQMYDNIG